jgi:hydrogenase expression/formation protein HypD
MAALRSWVEKVRNMSLPHPVRVMNVCGGHERSITMAGLRGALPKGLELIPGPGCPVCVCPEEDIYLAIQIAMSGNATLVAFGDMLRVPANVPKGQPRTLEQARAAGGDVRPIASPQEAWRIATEHPDRTVVFFAAGFETTMAPVAARIVQGLPRNLQFVVTGRLTWPAVSMLLDSGDPGFEALIAPGHVSTVMGPEEWGFVVEKHDIPTAIAGFESRDILVALHSVLQQLRNGEAHLDNCYGRAVRNGGNPLARRLMNEVFDVVDANWRGIGTIPASGYDLNAAWSSHDAREKYADLADDSRRRVGQMPAGCSCAQVVLGKIYPNACPLYGKACTPRNPVGPCMVSDEGACRIWWAGGVRNDEKADAEPAKA